MMTGSASLGEALATALRGARRRLGDPLAAVGLVASSRTTAEQLARGLAAHGGAINVSLLTADQIVSDLGRPVMLAQGLAAEPAGWVDALLSAAIPRLAEAGALGPRGPVLRQPGWRRALTAALDELEAAGADPEGLLALPGEPALRERAALLAGLLRLVADQRQRERLYSGRQLEAAALQVLESGRPHAHQRLRAAVVVGDTLLSPVRCAVLRAFFRSRDTTRIRLLPLDNLPPAPHGLRLAAQGAIPSVVEVRPQPATALGHLQRHLFAADLPAAAGPDDGTVEMVATSDEVREVEVAARAVLAAVREGVALDRIAVVLPDAAQAEVLEQALARAGVPAAWLTGPPLARVRPARFLRLSLEVALGGGSPARWYQLLAQPGLEGLDRTGRRRWRALLGAAPADPRQILPWLEQQVAGPPPPADDEEALRQRAACRALRDNIRLLQAQLDALPREATMGAHARSWRVLLSRLWTPDRERARLLRALEGWGGEAGTALPLEAAAGLLREHLQATSDLHGGLTQRTIRVLPPMLALGGEYDRVFVTGMTEGRFPRRVEEGVLLSEELRRALAVQGLALVDPGELRALEQRRLAAVVAGCQGRLWLSTPRTELLEGRPLLPGSLLLDAASALAGRRISYSSLPIRAAGRRSLPVPPPEEALDAAEHRVALAAARPGQALIDLASDPAARRLLQLARSLDRLYGGAGLPDAWTGRIDPALLPPGALDGEPLVPAALAELVLSPSRFFFRTLLGAWPAASLRSRGRMSWRQLRRRATAVLAEVAGEQDVEAAFEARWRESIRSWAEAEGGLEPGEEGLLVELGRRQLAVLHRAGAARIDGHLSAEAAPIHPGLPLRVAVGGAAVQGSGLLTWVSGGDGSGPIKATEAEGLRLLVEGLALQGAGHAVTSVRRVDLEGGERAATLADRRQEVEAMVAEAHERATLGWWPVMQGEDRLALGRERAGTLDWAALLARLREEQG